MGAPPFRHLAAPINMVFIQAGVELAMGLVRGQIDPADQSQVKACFDAAPLMAGIECQMTRYAPESNLYLVVLDSYVFR